MNLTLADLTAIAAIAGGVMTAGLFVIRLLIRVHVNDALREFETEVRHMFSEFDARLRVVEKGGS